MSARAHAASRSPAQGCGLCLLTETYHPVVGGGETQARELAGGLASRGWQVTVVTRRSDPGSPRLESDAGATVRRVAPTGSGRSRKWLLPLTALPALLRVRARFDVIAVSGFRLLGIPAIVAARLSGKRCILKADSLGEMSGAYFAGGLAQLGLRPSFPPFRLFLALRNALFRRADAFVAISREIADELEACGVDPSRIHRIPNGVDTEGFRPASPELQAQRRARLGLPEGGRVVAYVGRLVRYKGLPVLLEAWRSLASSRQDSVLVLAGAGGHDLHDCEAELRDFVHRHDLGDRVLFAGEVADVAALLQAADAFAFPTENEAFGIALVEAMACGLPVVSTAVGGLRDLVRDGDNALVVQPGDAPALARALDRLLADPGLRERLGGRARRDAVEGYGIAGVVDRWASLAEGLIELGAARAAGSRVPARPSEHGGQRPPP